jgi:hypothetical protein
MRLREFATELWLPLPPDIENIFQFRARALRWHFSGPLFAGK